MATEHSYYILEVYCGCYLRECLVIHVSSCAHIGVQTTKAFISCKTTTFTMCALSLYANISSSPTSADIPAVKRVHNLLMQLYSELSLPDQEEWAQRVVVLSGDLGLPRLGLNGEEWSLLCESVDVVIHNGAVVNAAQPYAGTLNLESS